MRFTLPQLRKLSMPFEFVETVDIKDELMGFEDILQADTATVEGTITRLGEDKYNFNLKISASLILESAISLNEVPYEMLVECNEIFQTTNELNEDVNVISDQTIDTLDVIVTNILINKPMRAVLENEKLEYANQEDDQKTTNPFSDLQDLLKK